MEKSLTTIEELKRILTQTNDYSYEDFKGVYKRLYDTGTIKGGTTYRAGTMTEVLSAVDKATKNELLKIQKNDATARPKDLPCEIHHITVMGFKSVLIISPSPKFVVISCSSFKYSSSQKGN